MQVIFNPTKKSKSFLHHNGTVTEGGIEENLGNHLGRAGLPNTIQPKTEGTPEEVTK